MLLMRWDTHTSAIVMNFGMQGDIDVITHAKFYVNRFTVFGVTTPLNLHCSKGLAGCFYNSVSTAVQHCDRTLYFQSVFSFW